MFRQRKTLLTIEKKAKVAEFDMRGAIILLKSDDILAPMNHVTLTELEIKHTSPSGLLIFPTFPSDHVQFCDLRRLPQVHFLFSAGMDGISPQILKDLISK